MTDWTADEQQRLRKLIDSASIRERLVEYTRALREQDWQAVRACFTQGAWADYGEEIATGPIDEVLEVIRGFSDRLTDYIALAQDRVEIQGDRATSEFRAISSHWPLNREDESRVGMWFLVYCDELVREEDGEWKIARRRVEVDWRGSLRRE